MTGRTTGVGAILALLTLLLIASVVVSATVGQAGVSVTKVAAVVWHHLGGAAPQEVSPLQDAVVWRLRMPRVLLAVLLCGPLGLAVGYLVAIVGIRRPRKR